MRAQEFIPEASPDTPAGSVTKDLIISKLWLCQKLKDLELTVFDQIYILGSWYGAFALMLKELPFEYHEIICVDSSPEKHQYLSKVIEKNKISRVSSRCENAEDIKYPNSNILVINTSTNDMKGSKWLSVVPRGSIVAMQGRDKQEHSNNVETLKKFDQVYPLSNQLYLNQISIVGVDGVKYQRFMKIGVV